METAPPKLTIRTFAKSVVVPALLIFVLPIISWVFFLYAQSVYDRDVRIHVQDQIRADTHLTKEQKNDAIAYFDKVPFSQQLLDPEVAGRVEQSLRLYYATFRWMIRLSAISVISGIAVFLFSGLCVWFSLRSQEVQYYCLLISWNVLRIYSAIQTILLAILIVALSYWGSAIFFDIYIPKLIFLAAILALFSVGLVIKVIFTKPKVEFAIAGKRLKSETSEPLWQELKSICDKVGTTPPDQIIAGIDDNFFVTEQPLTVDGTVIEGKSLFISLPLLKQLHTSEATAILAHEMAHFSGDDTLYSKRISPLIHRYNNYLDALYENVLTRPVFHFLVCFRALFDLSLNKVSREREFRADAIAAKVTSNHDVAAALLRTVAYSRFRNSIEQELFNQQQELATVEIASRVESGFLNSIDDFVNDPMINQAETAHPFDTHPSLSDRLNHVGLDLSPEKVRELIHHNADGGWYSRITDADELERQMWSSFEEEFQQFHSRVLAYRFFPRTPEERSVVEKFFPKVTFQMKAGVLELDCERIYSPNWADPISFGEVESCEFRSARTLVIHFNRSGKRERQIDIKKIKTPSSQEFLKAFQDYYSRYLAADEYCRTFKETQKNMNTSSDQQLPNQGSLDLEPDDGSESR